MTVVAADQIVEVLEEAAHALTGARRDYDPLIELVGNLKYVLLGEATHGTHEFYKARAEITKRLIREKGFTVIAWEADWPDALRINRFIQGRSSDQTALEALDDFKRFPRWMSRNADSLDLIALLRASNQPGRGNSPKLGVYA